MIKRRRETIGGSGPKTGRIRKREHDRKEGCEGKKEQKRKRGREGTTGHEGRRRS